MLADRAGHGEELRILEGVFEEIAEELRQQSVRTPSSAERKSGAIVHKPLSPDLQQIVSNTSARIVGLDASGRPAGSEQMDRDCRTIAAMNNVWSITEQLEAEISSMSPGTWNLQSSQVIAKLADQGFHASNIMHEDVRTLLGCGGYAFLLEYRDRDGATPWVYQFGFPFLPDQYENLSVESLPRLECLAKHKDAIWIIWRTGVLYTIESVRSAFAELGIPIHPQLEGENLHRLGSGQATKLVVANAALEKMLVICNISRLAEPRRLQDIVTDNKASVGSNREVFDDTGLTRTHVDRIRSASGQTIAEILWRVYAAQPEVMLQRLLREGGVLRVKGWPIQQLLDTGALLAQYLRERKHSG